MAHGGGQHDFCHELTFRLILASAMRLQLVRAACPRLASLDRRPSCHFGARVQDSIRAPPPSGTPGGAASPFLLSLFLHLHALSTTPP
ncbi:hypothetical protein LX36DRAFT_500420 [Colletotrichum falcatum]|nr:hypothetical protein LX36DRAFT_500420 [Colletotrichum falcatum]